MEEFGWNIFQMKRKSVQRNFQIDFVLQKGVALRATTVGQKLEWQLLATAHDKQVPPCSPQQEITHSFRWCFISKVNLKSFRCRRPHRFPRSGEFESLLCVLISTLHRKNLNLGITSYIPVFPELLSSSNDVWELSASHRCSHGKQVAGSSHADSTEFSKGVKASLCLPSRSM